MVNLKEIPLQNRKALTHYVARRKLVLDLFDKVLENKLTVQNSGERAKTEALIQNLIFKQHTENRSPDSSDLWLLNEDFILFEGCSESTLETVKIDGEKIFRDEQDLTEEERNFKNSLKEDRYGFSNCPPFLCNPYWLIRFCSITRAPDKIILLHLLFLEKLESLSPHIQH